MSEFREFRNYLGYFVLIVIYIVANMILTFKEFYFLNFLPAVLFIVFLALVRLDIYYFAIIVLTPLSVQLIEFIPGSPVDFAIPTEPMLFGAMWLLVYKFFQHEKPEVGILHHPVSIAVYFYLFWMLITSITSSEPLVSFKFLLARIWFIVTFYFLAAVIFKKQRNISVTIWCYAVPMLLVVVYTIARHIEYGLEDQQVAHIVMSPFFRDHTSYGAVLAMLVFALGGVVIVQPGRHVLIRIFSFLSLGIFAAALVLSYTRAAWISVLISLFILGLILLKIRYRIIMLLGLLVVILLFANRTEIITSVQQSRQESSSSFGEHLRSVSNITTDVSNLERINRWNCALRMFRERPLFGWGPGTYMFKYAPFQISYEMTEISTNFGDLGNAHSEYLGPLAESGFPGAISFMLVGALSLATGFSVFRKVKSRKLKIITLSLTLGFLTYLIHGLLNNFLDMDKASALFWGFTAAFVSLDVFHVKNKG